MSDKDDIIKRWKENFTQLLTGDESEEKVNEEIDMENGFLEERRKTTMSGVAK